jgi:hypothetical protein
MNKLSPHQLSQLLYSITHCVSFKAKLSSMDDILDVLFTGCDNFRAPFYIPDTFICQERYPLYSEVQKPKRSAIVDLLKDNTGQACLISDSVIRGKEGLFFTMLTEDRNYIAEWLSFLQATNLYVTEHEGDYILVSPVLSFISTS